MQMPTVHIRESPRPMKSDAVIQQIEGSVHHIVLPIENELGRAILIGYLNNLCSR